jgi:16S rRNA (guanine966-N2)-methyltransferase
MAREAIFSMVESRGGVEGLVVADLYCGSGAMGIEAMSRGATACYFVDSDGACLAAAKTNWEALNLPGTVHFVKANLPKWAMPAEVGVVFADPPYGPLDIDALLGSSKAEMAIIENDRFATAPAGWTVQKEKRYGTTLVTVLVVDGEDAS